MEYTGQDANRSNVNGNNDVTMTIRILFHGREVVNVIGKRGETVKNIREQSGAKILISDSSTPERIVTITGTTSAICKATEHIGNKVEEYFERQNGKWNGPKVPLTFNLLVPASLCGYIIGKSGCKIKEIRDISGAAIQVVSQILPNSTERLVSITGNSFTISKCVFQVCSVLLNTLPRKSNIFYDPQKKTSGPTSIVVGDEFVSQHTKTLASLTPLGFANVSNSINPAVLDTLAGSQLRSGNLQNRDNSGDYKKTTSDSEKETLSMTVPNNLIGCVIGKGGSKIEEIRQISGALVYIAKGEGTHENGENKNRLITITGNQDSISLAVYLINMSLELQKANLERTNPSSSSDAGLSSILPTLPTMPASPFSSAIQMGQLFAKSAVINALSSLSSLGALYDLFETLSDANQSSTVQTTSVHYPTNYYQTNRSPSVDNTKADKNKFAPY